MNKGMGSAYERIEELKLQDAPKNVPILHVAKSVIKLYTALRNGNSWCRL
jgi:hypothetical protein